MKYQVNSLPQLSEFIKEFIPYLEKNKIFLLYGEMGVGKTTFIQETLREIGILELSGSPTYSLINTYENQKFGELNHLDLYRLKSIDEAYDIGLEELFDNNSICFIEWPQKIIEMLPKNYISVYFTLNEDLTRTIEINETKKV
ncbi:MAG: tRNA (adenosine(37)-N6)-threonylcarbamoyltransferase complex ATPase subunit type 1 TsaE [Bacteroidota bacterium]